MLIIGYRTFRQMRQKLNVLPASDLRRLPSPFLFLSLSLFRVTLSIDRSPNDRFSSLSYLSLLIRHPPVIWRVVIVVVVWRPRDTYRTNMYRPTDVYRLSYRQADLTGLQNALMRATRLQGRRDWFGPHAPNGVSNLPDWTFPGDRAI